MRAAADRARQPLRGQRILAANVDVALLAAGGVAGDGHRLDDGERILLHEDAVLERAGLRLVGVADEVVGTDGGLGDGLPLAARRKGGSPAPDELRVDDLAQDSLGAQLHGPAQGLVAALGAIVVEARGIDVADAAQQPQPGLAKLGQSVGSRRWSGLGGARAPSGQRSRARRSRDPRLA